MKTRKKNRNTKEVDGHKNLVRKNTFRSSRENTQNSRLAIFDQNFDYHYFGSKFFYFSDPYQSQHSLAKSAVSGRTGVSAKTGMSAKTGVSAKTGYSARSGAAQSTKTGRSEGGGTNFSSSNQKSREPSRDRSAYSVSKFATGYHALLNFSLLNRKSVS